jgi:protein SCO1/2
MVERGEPGAAGQRGLALRRRDILILLAVLVAAGVVAAILIRSPAAQQAPGGAVTTKSTRLEGLLLAPAKPAPPLALRNYLGTPVNITAYRGKAVLVTFLYTHCPDVCPLIASKLHTALSAMSAAERRQVQIIAVSVDPRGDTPTTVAQFLADHRMTGSMQYLIGSRRALGPVWVRWGVTSQADQSNPALVDHSALIYGITGRGKLETIYPASFAPSEIVHDVRVLARA